jgi:hypothetical protein
MGERRAKTDSHLEKHGILETSPTGRWRVRVRWLALALLVASACAADEAAKSDFLVTVEAITPDGALPIMALAQQVDLDEAEHTEVEAVVAACMEQGGFTYEPVPWFGPSWTEEGRYGYTDVAEVIEYGYEGPPPGEPDSRDWEGRQPPPEWGWEEALLGTERAGLVWEGAAVWSYPVGGCDEEGHTAVVGDYRAWMELMEALQRVMGGASSGSGQDPRVQAVVAAWSECMSAVGYPVAVFGESPYTSRAAAVADATCNVSVGVAPTWRAVEAEYQWSALAAHEGLLTELLSRTTVSLGG